MAAYHHALDLHPNYPRVWVNLGITFDNKGDHKKAAEYFLSALSLNPDGMHIWGYLRSCFSSAGWEDLRQLSMKMDVSAFKDKFYIVSRDQLPVPARTVPGVAATVPPVPVPAPTNT